MLVTVSGKKIELKNSRTIADFIVEYNITTKLFVIEKNLRIISKEEYKTTLIEEGDIIEIVGFCGGG